MATPGASRVPQIKKGHSFKNALEKTEGVLMPMTKIIKVMEGKSYEKDLKEIGMFSLQKKMLNIPGGSHEEERKQLFSLAAESRTQNNGSKLQESRFRLDIKTNFFTIKPVRQKTRLPRELVDSPSLEVFKKRADRHWSGIT